MTLGDISVGYASNSDEAPTFVFEAGSDSGRINLVSTSGGIFGSVGMINIEIRDGGGWILTNDLILFDYSDGVTESPTWFDPSLGTLTLPVNWMSDGVVFDEENNIVYIENLRDLTQDIDADGVANYYDLCPNTPGGTQVNADGCPDADGDGVADANDLCPDSDPCNQVSFDGCPDADGDGIKDVDDLCPNTPAGTQVNSHGCPDGDGDNVKDSDDLCPGTLPRLPVDGNGCVIDLEFRPDDCSEVIALGYRLDGDFDGNCYGDLGDFLLLVELWLADCGISDCAVVDLDDSMTVDLIDFAGYSDNLGRCNDPCGSGCTTNWPASLGQPVALVSGNVVQFDITIAQGASTEVQDSANELASYLQQMTGDPVAVQVGDGTSGIAVGLASDFPNLNFQQFFYPEYPFRTTEYLLLSHDSDPCSGIYIIAATEEAVGFAVYDLLRRMGYRRFMPGTNWDIVPGVANFEMAVDYVAVPDYPSHGLFIQGGYFGTQTEGKYQWDVANRMQLSIVIYGHAWNSQIYPWYLAKHGLSELPAAFYLDGDTGHIDLDNNDVINDYFGAYAVEQFENDPDLFGVSLEPWDGWSGSTAKRAEFDAGNTSAITDWLVNMLNQVQQIVRDRFNDGKERHVGFMAYNYHSPPPSIMVDRDLIIQPVQGFMQGNFTSGATMFDEVMVGWRAKAPDNIFLTYSYGSYYTGGANMPLGEAATSNPPGFAAKIAYLETEYNFSSYVLESGFTPIDNLGHYIASRVMWDVDEANDVDGLLDDFYAKAFAGVEVPIRRFFELIQPDSPVQYGYYRVGEMYEALDEAYGIATEPGIVARIEDLIKYTRYAEIRFDFSEFLTTNPTDQQKEDATTDIMKYLYRMHDAAMVSTRMAMLYAFSAQMGMIAVPEAVSEFGRFELNDDPCLHPWYDDTPFTPAELQQYMTDGIANYSIPFPIDPCVYSTDLVSTASLNLVRPPGLRAGGNLYAPDKRFYYWLAESPAESFDLEVMGYSSGYIGRYYGPTIVTLYHMDPNTGGPAGAALSTESVPWDDSWHDVTLTADGTGVYYIDFDTQIDDDDISGAGGSQAKWPSTVKITQRWDQQNIPLYADYSETFFVPTGTTMINAVHHPTGASQGPIYDPCGNVALEINTTGTYFQIPVPPGTDGKLWGVAGVPPVRLLNIPSYWAQNANQLLLPAEVVAAE